MTTYSKETSLFKTNAIEQAIEDASETASNYITEIGDDGIKVHYAGGVNTDYSLINSNGLEVVSDSTSVAQFGSMARIGENGKARVEISSSEISVMSEDAVGFSIKQGASTINSLVSLSLNIKRKNLSPTSITVADLSNAVTGTEITLRYKESNTTTSYKELVYVAGTSATKTTYSGNATIAYNASANTFTYTHGGGSGTTVMITFVSVLYFKQTTAARVELLGEIYVNENLLQDYIVEQGQSGDWNYKIYASGKCELWRTYTTSLKLSTSRGGSYTTSSMQTLTLPFGVDNAVCLAGTIADNAVFVNADLSNSTTLEYRPYRGASMDSSASFTFVFRVFGELS